MLTDAPGPGKYTLIAAMTEDGIIGVGGGLPWPNQREDMAFFRRQTTGKTVIMGRKTYTTIVKTRLPSEPPLIGRQSIVVTRDAEQTNGTRLPMYSRFVDSLDGAERAAVEYANGFPTFVIGGAEIYDLFCDLAECLILTRMHLRPGIETVPEGERVYIPQRVLDRFSVVGRTEVVRDTSILPEPDRKFGISVQWRFPAD